MVRLSMLLSSISRSWARSLGIRRYLLPLILVGVNCIAILDLPTRRLDRTKQGQYHNRGVTSTILQSSQESRLSRGTRKVSKTFKRGALVSGVGRGRCVSGDLDRPGGSKDFTRCGGIFFLEEFVLAVPGAYFVKRVGNCFNR